MVKREETVVVVVNRTQGRSDLILLAGRDANRPETCIRTATRMI